ncbi:MAG: hypothetical protein ACLT38_10605 [Akkermansia sp.]
MFFLDFTGSGTYPNRSLSLLLLPGPITSVHMLPKHHRYTYETTPSGYRLAICKNKVYSPVISPILNTGALTQRFSAMRGGDTLNFEQGNLLANFSQNILCAPAVNPQLTAVKNGSWEKALSHVRQKAKVRS